MEFACFKSKGAVFAMAAATAVALTWAASPATAMASADEGEGLMSAAVSAQATDIEDESVISIDDSDAYYTGTNVTPNVKVEVLDDNFEWAVLTEGKDYTLSFQDNVNAGTAKVIVSGKGDYTGQATREFDIGKRFISDDAVVASAIPDCTFTGTAFTPEPTLKIGSYTLKKGVDYNIAGYYANVDAGTAHVDVEGIGNFTSSDTVAFTIKPASISGVTFAIADQPYTGYAVTPIPVATFNGAGLNSWDYTVTYSNNVSVGTAQAHIIGNGNFTGSKDVSFKIVPSATSYESDLVVVAKSKAITVKFAKLKKKAQKIKGSKAYYILNYNGTLSYSKSSASAKGKAAKFAKKIKVNSANGTITMPKKAPKGTYTVNVTVTETNGNVTGSQTVAVKIKVK